MGLTGWPHGDTLMHRSACSDSDDLPGSRGTGQGNTEGKSEREFEVPFGTS